MKNHQPILNNLENYDFTRVMLYYCENCNKKTKHELYNGHSFAESTSIILCLGCKQRALI